MNPTEQESSPRAQLIQRVVEECIECRTAGAASPDDEVIAAHPDLMPELAQELRKLALVEAARRQARSPSASPEAEVMDRSGAPRLTLKPDLIPGYEIVRKIRLGGQGRVYEAIQQSTRRKVAIKVMREGPFAGPADRSRFEREVQILGQLNHPNIVAIHDSGVAEDSFYYVMDYIPGQPLDVYMAGSKCSVKETLELFAKICDAVNAAHLRGVIHRDLKPGNVQIDRDGEPHILDFGLAKVAEGAVTEAVQASVMTVTGQFLGSLPYASPEQAEGMPGKTDMRTDVYALGVILYQMLTGRFPYEVTGNMRDALDRIMKADPVRPSTLRKQINDEVETIVLKCLAKERERRYQTAGELARDVRHYLAGEPIEAKRDSTVYMLRKQIRKHRVPLGVAAGFLLVLVGSSVALTVQAAHVVREAEAAEEINRFFNDMLASIDPMQLRAFSGFAPDGPVTPMAESRGLGREIAVADMMRLASIDIEQRFAGKPLLEAQARETIGMTFRSLWLFEEAEDHLQAALHLRRSILGEDDPHTLRSKLQLADALWWDGLKGHADEAEDLARSAYEGMRAGFGADDPRALTAGRILARVLASREEYPESDRIFGDTLAAQRRTLGSDHRDTILTMHDWVFPSFWQGKFARGYSLSHEAYELSRGALGAHNSLTIRCQLLVGIWHIVLVRDYDLAEQWLHDCLGASAQALGEDHPFIYTVARFLGQALHGQGRLDEAETYYRESLDGHQETYGVEQFRALWTMGMYLPDVLVQQGEFEEAAQWSQRALDTWRRVRGEFYHPTMVQMAMHVTFLLRAGKGAEARRLAKEFADIGGQLMQRDDATGPELDQYAKFLLWSPFKDLRDSAVALEAAKKAVELTDREAPWLLNVLAVAYERNGDLESAIEAQKDAIAALPDVESYSQTLYEIKLAHMLKQRGDASAAETILRDAFDRTRRAHGDGQAELVKRMTELASVLLDGGHDGLTTVCSAILQARHGKWPDEQGNDALAAYVYEGKAVAALVSGLLRSRRYTEAETILRAYLRVQEVALAKLSWPIANTRSLLGAALAGRNRFEEAESLLLGAFTDLENHRDTQAERLHQAGERLVRLYEAWGKPDVAAEWRATLSADLVATDGQHDE